MSQDLNDYGGPDPVGGLLNRLKLWADQNPVKAEGSLVCAAYAGAWVALPTWSLATAYPFRFGLVHALGALAWCIRFEAREQRLQRWLLQPGHAFRWVVDSVRWVGLDAIEAIGHWQWTDGKPKRKTATEVLDEMQKKKKKAPKEAAPL